MATDLFPDQEPAQPTATKLFAEIVFDRPLDHAYTYAVPEQLHSALAVGKRVQAPFGKGDKATTGFCVGITDRTPARAVKSLYDLLDEDALLTPDLLRLTRWMADYYMCGWGQVLNAVVPAGAKEKAGTRTAYFVEAIPPDQLSETPPELTVKQKTVLEILRKSDAALETRVLAQQARCGTGPIEALVAKGYARRESRRIDTLTLAVSQPEPEEARVVWNADQLRAWAPLERALADGGFHAFLLHGVTGSGKTEIYLRAIEEVIWQGKQALVLVPEISLTPQTIQRFRGRCGEVAVLHSHLTNAERGNQWRRVRNGEVAVIVGARSAVFAPTCRLGLIVIDEEHEATFKQDNTPRYHARDVAVMRARLENLPILLGSATPSLESWHNAERGQYTKLTLPSRVLDRPLPQVALIDLRHEGPRGKRFHALGQGLERAMRDALRTGGQVILLLNRRGFSTYVHCPSCGAVLTCKFCDLTMTYHRERDVLMCHHCGAEQEPPKKCAACGQAVVLYQGLGTEKLEQEIEEKFHGFVARRMDSDTMQQRGSHERVLTAFRSGLVHILFGTQMIAKGLDFPNVTLVGVVNADVGLHVPDFRSQERTFQLLAQVAGRAGRGPQGGRVVIQTYNPEQPCIALAASHDYASFVAQELSNRRLHNYPPYQRLARLIVRSKNETAASNFAEQLAGAFQLALRTLQKTELPAGAIRILGPAEAPVFRLKGYFRYHFQLQSTSPAALHQLLRAVLPATRTPSGVEFTLDVDPFNML